MKEEEGKKVKFWRKEKKVKHNRRAKKSWNELFFSSTFMHWNNDNIIIKKKKNQDEKLNVKDEFFREGQEWVKKGKSNFYWNE